MAVMVHGSPVHDAVCILLQTNFDKWKDGDQLDLIQLGRPKPVIYTINKNMVGRKKTGHFHVFRTWWYDKFPWLCGSVYLQNLHCWPCLLFGEKSERWYCDQIEKDEDVTFFKDHQKTAAHICNQTTFEDFFIETIKRVKKQKLMEEENKHLSTLETIRLNRQCVVCAVDAILAMIKKQFPFTEVEPNQIATHAEFTLVVLNATKDSELKNYFQKLRGICYSNPILSFHMQVNIVQSISECIEDYIYNIVNSAKFFTIRIDDGLNDYNECSIFLRCINSTHSMKEFFLGHYNLGADKTSLSLFRIIDTVLEKYQYKTKLVGICYDITCVKFNYLKDLRVGLKFMAQQAIHVNMLGHSIDYMLERCLCSIPTCRVFFSHIGCLQALIQSLYKKKKLVENSVWNNVGIPQSVCVSKFKLLSTVVSIIEGENSSTLKAVLEQVLQDDSTAAETLFAASSMLDKLKDFEFLFLCVVFNHIFEITDSLYGNLNASAMNPKLSQEKVKETCVTLYRQRNESFLLNHLYQKTTRVLNNTGVADSALNRGVRKNLKPLYYEIIDNTIMELHTRFENIEHYEFLTLGNSFNYESISRMKRKHQYMGKAGDSLMNHFPLLFTNRAELQVQWQSVVTNQCNWKAPVWRILQSVDSKLCGEAYKLFSLLVLLTQPNKDTAVPCLHRVKNYLDGNVAPQVQPPMAKILMNQEILNILNCWYSFKDDIMNKLSIQCDTIKLSHMVKSLPKDPSHTSDSTTHILPNLSPNLLSFSKEPSMVVVDPESDMIVEIDPSALLNQDMPKEMTVPVIHIEPGPTTLMEPGPSTRVEPDSSVADEIPLAMTCEQFPGNESQFDLNIKIKEEPEDISDILSANVERELGKFSHGSSVITNEDSLFQPPVLIKDEVVSEDEL